MADGAPVPTRAPGWPGLERPGSPRPHPVYAEVARGRWAVTSVVAPGWLGTQHLRRRCPRREEGGAGRERVQENSRPWLNGCDTRYEPDHTVHIVSWLDPTAIRLTGYVALSGARGLIQNSYIEKIVIERQAKQAEGHFGMF